MQALIDFVFPPQLEEDEDLRAARIVTQSFMHTKSYVEIFRGEPESRREAMEFLFRRNIYMVRKKCPDSIHCIKDDSGNVQCFFMLVPSSMAHASLYEKIVVGGILEFGVRYGTSTLMRLIRIADFSDKVEQDAMKGRKDYFSLQRMIVAPELQGKGIGSKYLGEALKEADRKQVPVVMTTQEPRNLIYYGRLGFKVISELEYKVPEGDDAQYNYTSWLMVREPQPLHTEQSDADGSAPASVEQPKA